MRASQLLAAVPQGVRGLVERLEKLQEIAIALSAQHDLARLLDLILRECRALTNADSGSMYVREDIIQVNPQATAKDPTIHMVNPSLLLKVMQNDSLALPFKELRLRIDKKTIAGYVARSGEIVNLADAYNLPDDVPFSYDRAFDETSGYRCKSMLAIPMCNRDNDIIGVVQLINKKHDRDARLGSKEDVERQVAAFDPFDEELARALGSQAAVCLEKAKLYEEIEACFEGLVQSFTHALEKRNRTTYGHSLRVTEYAVAIARAINQEPEGAFEERFTEEEIKELRYAALLHDIGKISVPEAVLDKRNKLLDSEIDAIAYRFAYWKERLGREGKPNGHLDEWIALVRRVNVPTGMTPEDTRSLTQIASATFIDIDGQEKSLLTEREFENLAIQRGNLTMEERRQIERHIVDTWEMLKRVPWPRTVRRVPKIAASHHEKVNGDGYPWGLAGQDIPIGGRILAIVDIYEALTAKDRPYKPAIPVEKALKILDEEAAKGALDAEIYKLFKDRKIYMMFTDETGFVHGPRANAEPDAK
ncbi:MAG: HD domain-containing protein [Planctomycetes bacterium]|nr:HD domain-containing protein [Planctomycetota bacterium]